MNVLTLDLNQLPRDVLNKIDSGEYLISNSGGVIRDISGKIIKHIPLKEISCENVMDTQQLLSSFQSSIAISTAISTGVILGAIIISTKLVLNKLDKIEELAEQILEEIYEQNRFQYFLQLKDYIAVGVSLRELAFVLEENRDLALMKLNELSIKRQGILIVSLERITQLDKLKPKHQEIVLNFLHHLISILPKLFYLERDVAIGLGRLKYAKVLEDNFNYEYIRLSNNYKKLLNEKYHYFLKGSSHYESLLNIINEYKKEEKLNNLLLKKSLQRIELVQNI